MKFAITVLLTFWLGYALGQSPIVAAEYFIDTDPGIGNGTSVSLSPGTSISLNFDVELEGLETGIHYLHTRVKNGEDKWSLYSRKPFHVTNFVSAQTIVSAEYFFDIDPGIGNGTALSITPGSEISENFAISIEDLDPGIHKLHIRVKNSQEKWSIYARKLFYIMPEQVVYNIVAAEYFIDTDPGPGNGIPLAITPGQTISEAFEISTSDTLMNGTHLLHIRVLDDADRWSLYVVNEFVVDSTIGIDEASVTFDMYPNPVRDVLNVKTDGAVISTIRIIDLNGKMVFEESTASDLIEIELGHLPASSYLVQVIGNHGQGVSRMIVKL